MNAFAPGAVAVTEDLVVRDPGTLLVLDGAERALDVCATVVTELLAWHADLRIVVTSTEVLDVPGERVLRVAPFDETALVLTEAVPAAYHRLDTEERLLLRRLSVLTEFDLATASALAFEPLGAVAPVLARLVAKSMVLRSGAGFRLLDATRAYAAFDLAARGEAEAVRERLRGLPAPAPPRDVPLDPALTGRQHEVLGLVAAGRTNAEIAAELGIAERTVDHHVGHMLTRLGLRTRTQLAVWASA
ncbi:hypothetical protein Lesp02_11750 [Lentzea sp. NBRC 105346]|nr:hypothetical protein Lesp02_11750 [Lentzea sp. NBRC 105346]